MKLDQEQLRTLARFIGNGLRAVGQPADTETIKQVLMPLALRAASGSYDEFAPPDAYAADLAKLRAAGASTPTPAARTAAPRTAGDDFTPPNPYDGPIAAMRRGRSGSTGSRS